MTPESRQSNESDAADENEQSFGEDPAIKNNQSDASE